MRCCHAAFGADQVRGRRVEEAYQILRFTKKMAAKDLEKVAAFVRAAKERA